MLLPLPEEGGRGEAEEMAVDPTALGPEFCLEARTDRLAGGSEVEGDQAEDGDALRRACAERRR